MTINLDNHTNIEHTEPKMNLFNQFDSTNTKAPPLTNDHCLLPLPRGKYAPRTLVLKGQQHELSNFLGVYNHLCAHFKITNSEEKCKGLITYCSPKVGRTIERFPSFIMGDYDQLVKDLEYFREEEEDTYNVGLMAAFTKKWRKRKIETKKHFKHYHRKYLELVGKALASGHISEDDNNRHFWEGIHHALRRRIEERMLVVDPDLDVSIPFEMNKVVKAVEHIYNRHRFDQHLLESRVSYGSSSESESEEEYRKPSKKHQSESDSEETGSEDSDHSIKKYLSKSKRRHSADKKPITFKKELTYQKDPMPKKIENEELSKLAQQMGKLSLKDARYRALYVDIIREMLDKPQTTKAYIQPSNENQYQRPPPPWNYNQPRNNENQFQREGPPRNYNQPRNNENQFQREGPPRSYNSPRNNDNHFQRDLPPHQNRAPPQSYGAPPGLPQGMDAFCFGCGKTGHRMMQCGELNGLLNQRVIVRNEWGKLQWPDGSPIRKDREDTWVQAIGKVVKRTNIVQAEVYSSDEEEEIHHYVGIAREDDDASSEDQEDLGWLPLPRDDGIPPLEPRVIGDCYAVGAERTPKISRNARKQVQFNPPGKMQGMKDLPKRGEAVSYNRQGPTINHSIHSDRYQPGAAKRITPLDVNQGKFEAKVDDQLIPMDLDQMPIEKHGDEPKKITTNSRRSETLKIPNPRANNGRTSSEIAKDIMKMPLTITVEEAVSISRSLQKDLTLASKPLREASFQTPEKTEKL